MKVVNRISVYEIDGKEVDCHGDTEIAVESHRNRSAMVVLRFGENETFTVLAGDLERAIKNATNWR